VKDTVKHRESLEEVARRIYGSEESPAFQRWVNYWKASRERNDQLFKDFEKLILLQLKDRRVLDIGCGTGGLGNLVGPSCKQYIGGDFNWHVLQFSRPLENLSFIQCNGISLPFSEKSFDLIFAFDIVEHLLGGKEWQLAFLKELKRILAPLGMVFFTTPNFWYPYDAHTDLYFPQFLPAPLRDTYIRLLNPEFLKEHSSFREIRLMRPGILRKLIQESGLASLHDLPCCLDKDEYWRLHPFLGSFAQLGFGWLFHAEFWIALVHGGEKEKQRLKLRKNWFYEQNQPSQQKIDCFSHRIDFRKDAFNHQLGPGWYWYEKQDKGFRWTQKRAEFFLESDSSADFLCLEGFSPEENYLKVFVEGTWVGDHPITGGEPFSVQFLVPFQDRKRKIFSVVLETSRTIESKDPKDDRKLGLMMFAMELTA
jgi:SAM-dependent methyltransferase